jgi:hypothetical protein
VRICSAVTFFVLLTAASAPKYTANWVAALDAGLPERVTLPKGKLVKIGRALPARLFELSSQPKFKKGTYDFFRRGTLIVPVDASLRKFCRLERHMGSAFACLSDQNADGKLDAFFGTQVFKEFFTGSVGDDGGHEDLLESVSFAEVDSSQKSPEISLELMLQGISKNSISFQFCLSKKINDNAKFYQSRLRRGFSVICSPVYRSDSNQNTKPFEGFGVQIEFIGTAQASVEAKVLPSQNRTFETSSGFR